MTAAKAITGALVTLVVVIAAELGFDLDLVFVEAVVGALVTGAFVYFVPNRAKSTMPVKTADEKRFGSDLGNASLDLVIKALVGLIVLIIFVIVVFELLERL